MLYAISPLFDLAPTLAQLIVGMAATFFGYFLYLVYQHRDGRALGTKPRPDLDTVAGGVPLLGNMLQMIKSVETQLEWWTALRRKQDDPTLPLSITLPGMRLIDIKNDVACLEHVLKTHFDQFEKHRLVKVNARELLGEGIFAVNGKEWKPLRQATARIFTKSTFRNTISTSISSDIDKLTSLLNRHADSGKEIDLQATFFAFTLDAFARLALGLEVGSLTPDGVVNVPFAQAFDYAQWVTACRFVNPFWRLLKYTERGRKMAEANQVMDSFAYGVIDDRRREMAAQGEKKENAQDLLGYYLAVRDENGQPMSRKALRDAVLNLIIAGRDTTAQALSWTYFHLLSLPHLFEKMRAEVDKLEEITFDNFKELPFLIATFNEGLRLHPSVPKASRVANSDNVLPNGTIVEKGDVVRWSNFEIGRDERVWGPDAKVFNPSRWIDEAGDFKHESQFKANYFHAGPRLCLGQNLATFEAVMVMATITRHFDVSFAPGYVEKTPMVDIGDPVATPRYANSLTLPMLTPFRVVVTRRTEH